MKVGPLVAVSIAICFGVRLIAHPCFTAGASLAMVQTNPFGASTLDLRFGATAGASAVVGTVSAEISEPSSIA